MKHKAQQSAKIGIMKVTKPDSTPLLEEKQPENEPEPTRIQATFSINQCYTVQFDEDLIDDHIKRYCSPPEDWKEDSQRFKRMYRAIVADKKALDLMQQFIALNEHDSNMERNGYESYIKAHFKQDLEFTDILTRLCHLFNQEDKQWWMDLVEASEQGHKRWKENGDDSGMFDLCVQVEALEHAFRGNCEQSGWTFERIAYHCDDCGSDF